MQASDLLPFHPVAIKFGNLNGAEFDALVSDIKTNNQKVPIVMHNGMIIDGIQRYRACLNAKVEPIFTEFGGEEKDIVRFIASMNMHRRHLSTKRKKEIALELLKADPTISDLAISKTTRLSDKTITQIRADAVRRSEIPNVTVRSDTKEQPAKKCKARKTAGAPKKPLANATPVTGLFDIGLREHSASLAEKLRAAELKIAGLESEVEELKAENAKLREQLGAADRITKKQRYLELEANSPSN
jgi:ParB-like chromosome segregation protein Spo0J